MIWIPKNFRYAQPQVGPPAPDEECVTEAIQVFDSLLGDALFLLQRNGEPLGSAADGSAGVQLDIQPAAAGKHEGRQLRQIRVSDVDIGLQLLDIGVSDPGLVGMNILGPRGQDRSQVEDLVLHPQRFGIQPVPWLVADGFVADYQQILNDLPLILVTSNWVREVYIRDGLEKAAFEVLPVGCDTDSFTPRPLTDPKVTAVREALGVAPDEIMILTVQHPLHRGSYHDLFWGEG